ncbi:MAG: ABC transporter substrate-binding protein [Aeromicrobium sp.]|uniref:ABC transporter substrate-binding protein n=1 Tax=Aeromicrobium sp. TaxID=1871063 RepID=UPI0039E37BFC
MLTACGSSDDDKDSADGACGGSEEITLEDGEPRVVALGWSDGEIALELGVKPVAVYDWMAFGEENKGVGPWACEAFGDEAPELLENTGEGYNYEQIELLEPDVILNVRAGVDAEVTERLEQIAPVASAPEGTADFAVDWRTQTEIVGEAVEKDDEATTAIEETDAVIAEAAEANPDFAGKTFVFGTKYDGSYGAYLEGDARFDVFAALGFVANPALDGLETLGFSATVPAEKVSALDAQVAILTTIFLPLSDLEEDPLITSLDVVKDDRAVILDEKDEIVTGFSAGTPSSIALAVEKVVPLLADATAKVS